MRTLPGYLSNTRCPLTLTTTYNKIATLEAEVTCLQGELTRLPRGNIALKAKVPELPTFAGSENKMQLHDWLSVIFRKYDNYVISFS